MTNERVLVSGRPKPSLPCYFRRIRSNGNIGLPTDLLWDLGWKYEGTLLKITKKNDKMILEKVEEEKE